MTRLEDVEHYPRVGGVCRGVSVVVYAVPTTDGTAGTSGYVVASQIEGGPHDARVAPAHD